MIHEHMPPILRGAYFREKDPDVRAQMARVAISLMSVVGEEILEDARHSSTDSVRKIAQQIGSAENYQNLGLFADGFI